MFAEAWIRRGVRGSVFVEARIRRVDVVAWGVGVCLVAGMNGRDVGRWAGRWCQGALGVFGRWSVGVRALRVSERWGTEV